jgi:D-3-phosphoglycerate dehydrogenase
MTPTAPDAPLVVVCGLDHVNLAEEQDVLGKAGVRLQTVIARTEAEYLERCGEADGLLIQYGAITRRVLEGLPRVRVLVRYGVGVDGIDVAAATDHGVPVVNVPDYGTDEVANHAVALLLSLARKIARLDRQTRSGGWDVFRVGPVTRLAGQTVGIVGAVASGRPSHGSSAASTCGYSVATRTSRSSRRACSRWPSSGSSPSRTTSPSTAP